MEGASVVGVCSVVRGPLPVTIVTVCGLLIGAALEPRLATAQESTAQNTTAQNTSNPTLPTINVVGVSPIKPPPPQRKPAPASGVGTSAPGAVTAPSGVS